MIATALLVGAAGIGLVLVRTGPPAARLCAWVAVLAFALAAAHPLQVAFAPAAPRSATVDAGAGATSVLGAAATAGPRAVDLVLRWSAPLPTAVGTGPLGTRAELPEPALSVDPRQVQVRALGEPAVGRPLRLQIEAPGLGDGTHGELVLQRDGAVIERQSFDLRGGVAACTWLPDAAGPVTVACELHTDGHRLNGAGLLAISAAPEVLVLDPSGVAAAALQAQGIAVQSRDTLPDDWRQRPALVLGRALPDDQQRAIVAAVQDGLGVFVLAPAFGSEGAPLRALLPLRPLPKADEGTGAAAESGTPPTPDPAPAPPPDTRPPTGDTAAAAPVGRDPIEVDKRAIAMVLLVDRSWSMGTRLPNGHTKMSYAKSSALRTAQALTAGDRVALVTFGNKDAGRVELPLTDATDAATVQAGIARLAHATESTYLLGGLRAANELLAVSRAAVKHVVVITDGEFDISEALVLQALARRMVQEEKATLSVISIIDAMTDASFKREAERITAEGGGQFFAVEDPTFVPTLVSAEVTRALQRVGREPGEGGVDPDRAPAPPPTEPPPPRPEAPPSPAAARLAVRAVAPSPLLLPEVETWPTLGDAVPGTAPLDAQVLLVAGDAGWPLLAFANRGLGRIGAFAADLGGAPGTEFRADAAFPGRFAQWVQAVLPAVLPRTSPPLLGPVQVAPAAPTQRDVAWLTELAGVPPVVAPPAPPAPPLQRTVASEAPRWALALLLVLVALAVCERYAGLWSLGRTRETA